MLTFDSYPSVKPDFAAHMQTWEELLEAMKEQVSLSLVPTTLSIKVADKTALFEILAANAQEIEQVHIGTVNERYIASATLRKPFQGLAILKILERRPGSSDPLGLDSIDYLVSDLEDTYRRLKEAGLDVIKEHNDMHAWLSLRFGEKRQFEAKVTDHLVVEVAIKELALATREIRSTLKRP